MKKKNGLNVIYDARGKRMELNGKLSLKNLPNKEYYLTKTHLVNITHSSRETVDDIIKQLNLGYRFFNSSFGDLLKWYLFDAVKMRDFIVRVKDVKIMKSESAGNLVEGINNKSAEFHFERLDCGDL